MTHLLTLKLSPTSHLFIKAAQKYNHDPLFELCAQGVMDIMQHKEVYQAMISASRPFLHELLEASHCLKKEEIESDSDLQARAFQIFECLALVMREVQIKLGRYISPAQQAICTYFEESGQWRPADNTLASQYYYIHIPFLAMRMGMQKSLHTMH